MVESTLLRNVIERTSWDDAAKLSNKGVVFAIFELDYLLTIHAKVFLYAFWEMTNYLIQEKPDPQTWDLLILDARTRKSDVLISLLMGNSDSIGGDGWTSALTEVPIIMGNNGNNGSAPEPVQSLQWVGFGTETDEFMAFDLDASMVKVEVYKANGP
nr:hypothetical protein [Tanacetum cinerariifolium]